MAVGLLLLVGLSACGKSGPTKAAYVKEANGVCDTFNARFKALPQPTDSSTLAQVTSFLDQTVSLVQEETDKLKALKTPSADKATLAGIIDAQANQIPQVQAASSKFKAGDTAGGNQAMQTISTDSTSVDQKFDSYGLTSCGSKSG